MLRFFALWEDADSLNGKTSPVTIRYFLVDNTVEVRLVDEPNSGREAFTGLMGRIRLPKKIKSGSGEQHCRFMVLGSFAINKAPFFKISTHITLYCVFSRVFSQLCSGGFPTGSGGVLFPQRFPGRTKS